MTDQSTARRVSKRDVVIPPHSSEELTEYGKWTRIPTWKDDPNGTHVLVTVEVWERVVEALRAAAASMESTVEILNFSEDAAAEARPYVANRAMVARHALAEIGGEDE